MANEIEIPIKLGGVQSLKAELRSLKASLAEATDPAQMDALAQRAGDVADRIKDANDQVNVFASGSKFEQISNSFGGIKDSLMSLDFEEASGKAQTFAKTLGNLNAADISKSMKGLTSTITTMGGAFVKLGAQILMNPIFLLVAVIAAIVVGIGIFLNKIGVLQKVLDFLMIPINALINGFKELTDWLGLTSYAAEENARTMEKANEKAFKSSEKRTEQISDQYDLEIARAKAAGKDTTNLELQKSKAITDAAKTRLNSARDEYNQIKNLTDKDSVERRKKLAERIAAENKLIKDGSKERQLMVIQEQADQAAAAQKAAEEAKAKREEAAKKYREGAAAIQAEINAANKLVIDSGKTQQQKEVDDVKAKYAALIKEAQKYKKDITALEAARGVEIAAINKAAADAQAEKVKAENEKKYAAEDAQFLKLQELTLTNEEFRKLQAQIQYDADIIAAGENAELQKALTVKLQSDLNAIDKEGKDKRKATQDQLNTAILGGEEALQQARLGLAKAFIGALGELAGQNKKLANAAFLLDKALAIGEIIVNTQKEVSGIFAANAALFGPAGPAVSAPYVAAAKIRAATSIGTIVASSLSKFMGGGGASVNVPSGGGGGGGGGGSTPTAPSVPAFVPGNLYGQGNQANTVTQSQGVEANQTITVNAVVSETEMTGVQNKVSKIIKNSVL